MYDLNSYFTGKAFDVYNYFGAHRAGKGKNGYTFRIFAPRAKEVYIYGDFNGWEPAAMNFSGQGIYELTIADAKEDDYYKYIVVSQKGEKIEKADPYGFHMELPPGFASKIVDLDKLKFTDKKWMAKRTRGFSEAVNIYELHFGSWRQKEDGSWYNYRELAKLLIPYLKEHHITHVEVLPLSEHPLYGSWGYLVSCFFSVTSRYGTPQDFAYFVNECHKNNIGVIMDFVPAHFVTDQFGLSNFDGLPEYEYEDPTIAYNEWGSCNFNFFRYEVRSFLNSAADFWLSVYHIDGLRMDAVSNIVYWQGNMDRGVYEGGVEFLKGMTSGLHERHDSVMLIAEESTTYPDITRPVEEGGLGFDYKWDMGWMNDTLEYFKIEPIGRKFNYHKLSFSMMYFRSERFLLPLSHDEVVHGKATILQKMWGNGDVKFAQAKLLYMYMFTHPGKKLNFMGNEIGHFREWDEKREMDWDLLKYPTHDSFHHYFMELERLYTAMPSLYAQEYDPISFRWLEVEAADQSVYVYERKTEGECLVIVLNMCDVRWENFTFGIDREAEFSLLLDSDQDIYGGGTLKEQLPERIASKKLPYKNWEYRVTLDIPAFTGMIFEEKNK
jgi:1,4-alpha-glucan branching enzyme